MAIQYGIGSYRPKPRIRVRRGWTGTDAQSITDSYPPKAGEDIKSGQVMTLTLDGSVWKFQKGTKTRADAGDLVFFAFDDQDHPNVRAAKLLPGLSVFGGFVIETAYFDTGGSNVYNPGAKLAVSATAGNIKERAATEPVIGYSYRGKVSYKGPLPNTDHNTEANIGGGSFDGDVVSLVTCYTPVIS